MIKLTFSTAPNGVIHLNQIDFGENRVLPGSDLTDILATAHFIIRTDLSFKSESRFRYFHIQHQSGEQESGEQQSIDVCVILHGKMPEPPETIDEIVADYHAKQNETFFKRSWFHQ